MPNAKKAFWLLFLPSAFCVMHFTFCLFAFHILPFCVLPIMFCALPFCLLHLGRQNKRSCNKSRNASCFSCILQFLLLCSWYQYQVLYTTCTVYIVKICLFTFF